MENNIQTQNSVTTSQQPDNSSVVPGININLQNVEKPLISDDKILDYFDDAIKNIKEDREEARNQYLVFNEMVINEGDPSSATKEALVNCLKLQHDTTDKMIKILDLWSRIKMRDRDTMKGYIAVQQNNKIQTSAPTDVKNLIKLAQMESQNESL